MNSSHPGGIAPASPQPATPPAVQPTPPAAAAATPDRAVESLPDPRPQIAWNPAGLVPAIVQQHDTGAVLMLAWMDAEALHRTLTTGRATYFSRSRGTLWVKGETSGHYQYVRSVSVDCDADTVLVRVDQVGPACHTGSLTCFFTELPTSKGAVQ